jgi:ABC-2 type transport system permease protein
MRFLWRVLGVALFNFVFVKRQWMWILQNVIIALGVLFIALGWGGAVAVKTLVPIYIVISAWGFGLNIVAQMVGYDRVVREWERLVASPLQLIEYFTGLTLGTLPLMVSSIAPPILLYSLWSLDLRSVAIALLISPIAMILGSFLSLSIVLRIRNPMNISAITNPLMSVTTFLPPVLYPPTVLPEPAEKHFCSHTNCCTIRSNKASKHGNMHNTHTAINSFYSRMAYCNSYSHAKSP